MKELIVVNYDKYIKYYGKTEICKKLYNWSLGGNKINNLMRVVSSETNILLALKLISDNPGRNTQGTDSLIYKDIASMDANLVVKEVRKYLNYKVPKENRTVYIPKKNGKKRKLGIATIYNRIAQQAILNVLVPIAEAKFSDVSYAFRPMRTTKHAFARISNAIWNSKIDRYVIDIDLESYFDTIPLNKCINKLRDEFKIQDPKFLDTIKRLIWADSVDEEGNRVIYEGIGIPQGSVLGPILSNVYLNALDKQLELLENKSKDVARHFKKGLEHYNGWIDKTGKPAFKFVRYADDIRIVCNTEHEANILLNVVEKYCLDWDIKLSKEKTKVYSLAEYPYIEMVGFKARKAPEGFIISPLDRKGIRIKVRENRRKVAKSGKIMNLCNTFFSYLTYFDICTNNSEMISSFNKILYNMYYLNNNNKFKIDKEPNKDIYYIKHTNVKENRETPIDLWNFNQNMSRSIKFYNMDKGWNPLEDRCEKTANCEWLLKKSMRDTGYKQTRLMTYIPGLYNQQKGKDPITGEFLNHSCCVHHKLPLNKGGSDNYNNLCIVNYDTHMAIHNSKYEEKINIINKNQFKKLSKQAR